MYFHVWNNNITAPCITFGNNDTTFHAAAAANLSAKPSTIKATLAVTSVGYGSNDVAAAFLGYGSNITVGNASFAPLVTNYAANAAAPFAPLDSNFTATCYYYSFDTNYSVSGANAVFTSRPSLVPIQGLECRN
ncbi:hypothetical protein [Parasitella parasitica]|uniref:Uncharacterized protein n=1 Tax=Parasitella parasitica TaxID=35722 RepID=A0A0B7NBE2_9FUNG|nr:hypothetical protein [Parasitella parasitica]